MFSLTNHINISLLKSDVTPGLFHLKIYTVSLASFFYYSGPLHNKQALLFILFISVSGDYLVHAGFPPVENKLSTSGKRSFH